MRQHRRLREIPIHGGASALRESVPLDPLLYDYAVKLLEALDWTWDNYFKFNNPEPEAPPL